MPSLVAASTLSLIPPVTNLQLRAVLVEKHGEASAGKRGHSPELRVPAGKLSSSGLHGVSQTISIPSTPSFPNRQRDWLGTAENSRSGLVGGSTSEPQWFEGRSAHNALPIEHTLLEKIFAASSVLHPWLGAPTTTHQGSPWGSSRDTILKTSNYVHTEFLVPSTFLDHWILGISSANPRGSDQGPFRHSWASYPILIAWPSGPPLALPGLQSIPQSTALRPFYLKQASIPPSREGLPT